MNELELLEGYVSGNRVIPSYPTHPRSSPSDQPEGKSIPIIKSISKQGTYPMKIPFGVILV
jgi:hypothetical protein